MDDKTKRSERNKRYYDTKKVKASASNLRHDSEATLIAQRREIDLRLAELRQQQKSHIPNPSEEGTARLALSKRLSHAVVKQAGGDYELVLMVSEDLRAEALKPELE